jgi:hypothetical protein
MLQTPCPVCKHQSLMRDEQYVYCTNCHAYRNRLKWYMRPVVWTMRRTGWWWRLPILGMFAFFLWQNWQNPAFALDRFANPFSALDFGLHEMGHFIFMPFGEFMHILGGSLFQCLVPFIAMSGFLQVRMYFATAMCWCWLGLNFFDVATYIADAETRVLPLAGPGSLGVGEDTNAVLDQGHDWYQLLTRLGQLNNDLAIAEFMRQAATVVTFIGLILGALIIIGMFIAMIRKTQEALRTT